MSPVTSLEAAELSFAEVARALRSRAERGDGNFRQALVRLTSAEQFEREASLLNAQASALRRSDVPRSGIRLSHLTHAITRVLKSRDRCLAEAETALTAACSKP